MSKYVQRQDNEVFNIPNLTPEWVAEMEKLKPWNSLHDYAKVSAEATTEWDTFVAALRVALAYKREMEQTVKEPQS